MIFLPQFFSVYMKYKNVYKYNFLIPISLSYTNTSRSDTTMMLLLNRVLLVYRVRMPPKKKIKIVSNNKQHINLREAPREVACDQEWLRAHLLSTSIKYLSIFKHRQRHRIDLCCGTHIKAFFRSTSSSLDNLIASQNSIFG